MCGSGVIFAWKIEHEPEVKIVCYGSGGQIFSFEAKRILLLDYYSGRNRKNGSVGRKARGRKTSQETVMLYQGKGGTRVREILEAELVELFGQLDRSNKQYGHGMWDGARSWQKRVVSNACLLTDGLTNTALFVGIGANSCG